MFKTLRLRRNRRILYSLSSSEDDRVEALFRLAESGDRRAVGIVVEWLIQSPTITPRDMRTAATVLPKLKIRDALSRLEPFLQNPVRRQRAFEVLAYLGESAEPLLKPLVAQCDPLAMAAYEVALGPKAIPFFLHLARMSEFGGARCVLKHGSEDDVDAMLMLLIEKGQLAILQPLLAEHFHPTTETQRTVQSVFQSPTDRMQENPNDRWKLTDEAMIYMAAALTNADESVRSHAAHAIVNAQPTNSYEVLIPMLRHRERTVRKQAATLLHQLKWHPHSREELLRYCIAADSFEPFVRLGAESVPQLLKVIEHSPASVAQALGRLGDSRASPSLIGLLRSREIEVQVAAAQALGAMHATNAAPALIQTLRLLQNRMEHSENPVDAELPYLAILKSLHQCLPDSPSDSLREEVRKANAVVDRSRQ
jgi:PBS lyase HEAT-like repeat